MTEIDALTAILARAADSVSLWPVEELLLRRDAVTIVDVRESAEAARVVSALREETVAWNG